jgi:HAD superfamily hydrolase (TIGR01509 family)
MTYLYLVDGVGALRRASDAAARGSGDGPVRGPTAAGVICAAADGPVLGPSGVGMTCAEGDSSDGEVCDLVMHKVGDVVVPGPGDTVPRASIGSVTQEAGVVARRRKPLTFDALIFDVDGTLADTEELHRQAFNEAFFACGVDWRWGPALYAELLQVTGGKERIASYLSQRQMPAAERGRLLRLIPQIHATKTRLYRELVALGHLHPRAGVRRLILEARSAGLKLAIASTTSPENVESLLTSSFGADASSWFDVVATGDVVANKKPAPDIYNFALARLGLEPQRAIAFEDSAVGVRSAKAAGLFTVATPSLWTIGQDFSSADVVLTSLADPERPLYAVDELRIGARYLGLDQLETLHSAALMLKEAHL